jgi:hypothetical protein
MSSTPKKFYAAVIFNPSVPGLGSRVGMDSSGRLYTSPDFANSGGYVSKDIIAYQWSVGQGGNVFKVNGTRVK